MARARSKRGLPNRTSGSRWKESNYRCSQERCLAFVSPAQASRLSSETLAGRTKGAHLEGPRRRTRGYTVVALRLDDTDSNFLQEMVRRAQGGGSESHVHCVPWSVRMTRITAAFNALSMPGSHLRAHVGGGHVGWSFLRSRRPWTSPPRNCCAAGFQMRLFELRVHSGDVALPHTGGAAPHAQGSGNANGARKKAHAGRARAGSATGALEREIESPAAQKSDGILG